MIAVSRENDTARSISNSVGVAHFLNIRINCLLTDFLFPRRKGGGRKQKQQQQQQ